MTSCFGGGHSPFRGPGGVLLEPRSFYRARSAASARLQAIEHELQAQLEGGVHVAVAADLHRHLQHWRQQFGRQGWEVGLDSGLATQVQLQYLDTKYLLNGRGVIQDVNVNIVDDQYLARIRQIVQGA